MRAGFNIYPSPARTGYIAGSGDGIVTIAGEPAARTIYVLDAVNLAVLRTTTSWADGRYLIRGLDPGKEYILFARDHHRDYEPVVYDYLKPATDLSHAEQEALWQQMLQVP